MIDFRCTGCGSKLEVDDSQAGHKIQCPDCNLIQDIPGSTLPPISFLCSSCQTDLNMPGHMAGKLVRCPHCNSMVLLPGLKGGKEEGGCLGLVALLFLLLTAGVGLACSW
jgi:DNA-directed RNA polymerase subunit RPC12/RpoP